MSEDKIVYVLIIHFRHGEDTYVYDTEDKANDAIFEYVKEWWNEETEAINGNIPKDKTEAIKLYFEVMEEEWADIRKCKIN